MQYRYTLYTTGVRGQTDPGQQVVLWGQFHCVKEGAEAGVVVEHQETEEVERPTICLAVPGAER